MLRFFFVFIRLVYPMLPVFLDCPSLLAPSPSVFSNVYLLPVFINVMFDCLLEGL